MLGDWNVGPGNVRAGIVPVHAGKMYMYLPSHTLYSLLRLFSFIYISLWAKTVPQENKFHICQARGSLNTLVRAKYFEVSFMKKTVAEILQVKFQSYYPLCIRKA